MENQSLFFEDGILEIRSLSDGIVRIRGYAAVFNQKSRVLVEKGRKFVEMILPGAFEGADFSDVEARLNHSQNHVLASSRNLKLGTDEKGLFYEYQHDPTDPDHQSVLAKISRRDISGSSFMFPKSAVTESWSKDGEMAVRTISKISRVLDVGPVFRPAYTDTSVFARSLDEVFQDVPRGTNEKDIELAAARIRCFLFKFPKS